MNDAAASVAEPLISNVVRPPWHPVGARCNIRQFRHTDFRDGSSPLVLVDHFVMTGPTFDVHPHAGMSAVTILFEDTRGRMSSHDSVHNDHLIEPGDLHWTLAGRGILHTQQPQGDAPRLNGLQLFVNLPRRLKQLAPATMLLRANDVPVIESPGCRLRLLAGSLADRQSPLQPPEPILIVDGQLASGAGCVLPLDAGSNMFLYARSGDLVIEAGSAATLAEGAAVTLSAGAAAQISVSAGEARAEFVAIAGAEMGEPIVQQGPFVLSSQEELERTLIAYRRGAFGKVLGLD